MGPRKSKVKLSFTNSDLQSETKRCKGIKSSECEIGSSYEESPVVIHHGSRSTLVPAVVNALDNHLILQEIFKNLSPADQRICCEVNEKWRAIAGPMIFEYQLRVDRSKGSELVITKGYLSPQIEKRKFVPEAETKYLETLGRRNCFISFEFCGNAWTREDHGRENYSTVDFVRKFSSRVCKLSCNYNYLYTFFGETETTRDLELLTSFPNVKEYDLRSLRSLDMFYDVKVLNQMDHLRRVYLGNLGTSFKRKTFPTKTPTFLQMIPNLQEIHGVPFTMISQFVKVNKLNLVRSIRFHGVDHVNLEKKAMKTLIRLGIKFKFLRIGRGGTIPWPTKEDFMKRTKPYFEDLLEIGKDTLQHLSLHFDRPENFIKFPETMSALTHITLRKNYEGPVLFPIFPKDFNFSKYFPKLTTISFTPMTLEQWDEGGSWWGSEENPVSKQFRKGIRNLRCSNRSLNPAIQRDLLRRFPSVNRIEFVFNIDDTDADGVIAD